MGLALYLEGFFGRRVDLVTEGGLDRYLKIACRTGGRLV